ncbi:MAG: glycosyltransferase [Rubrimonas sp.]
MRPGPAGASPGETRRPGRVALVLRSLDRYSETFIHRHVRELWGGRVAILSTGRLRHDALPVARIRRARSAPTRAAVAAVRTLLTPRVFHRLLFHRTRKFLERNDVVFILAEFGGEGIEVFEMAEAFDIPMFCYFRGFDASSRMRDPAYAEAVRRMAAGVAGFVVVAQALSDALAAHGVRPRRTLVIPSGADVGAFRPAAKRPASFLHVGRFTAKKAPLTTIRAFLAGTRAHPEATLDMVGDGPLLQAARDLVASHGAEARVRLRGVLPHAAVRELMAGSMCLLQHSVTAPDGDMEGFPSAVQEAMASGCAIVATRHAGIPEHVRDGETGLLVDEGDEEGFAAHVAALAADPAMAARLGRTARAYAEEHLDYRKLYARLEAEIAAEIARRSPGPGDSHVA